MKKSIIALILVLATLFTLASCASKGAANSDLYPELGGPLYDMGGQDYDASLNEKGEELADGELRGEDDKNYGPVNKFIENSFISTDKENVSTFAADVDTASYSYFRRLVESGYSLSELISTAGASIRTEEMINYFDYGYDSPEGDDLFSTRMQIAPCPWNEEAQLLVLGLQAEKIEISPKNNLVFLIDVSGSMNSEDKLGLLKNAFTHLTDKLDEDDTISIVTYSGNEKVVLEGCSGAKKDKILHAVNSLVAKGSTNGEAGLQKAYQIAEEYFIADGNNRIIMASDGDLNVGISSASELEKYISEKRESGVFLSVLGFGTGNYQDKKMETIANCGNGVYYYIDGAREAEKVFGDDIFSTLYTIAKDVKLQLTFDKSAISKYRLVGYENRLLNKEDFKDDTKDAGELGAGHSLTVCYEIVLTDAALESETPWMTLGVRHKAPDGDKSEENNYTFGKEVYTTSPDDNFKFICAVVETSMIIHESEYIKGTDLDDVKAELEAIPLASDEYKVQFRELIDKLISNGNK